jgi:hypothetical protein
VVFPPDRDPSDFIKKVIAGFADDHVGVVVLDHGGNGRLPVKRLSHDHPMRDDTRTVVLVVDASLAYGIADCFLRIDENTGAISSGPLIPKIDFWKRADNRPHVWKGIAWLLAGHLERIRSTNRVDAGSRSRVVKVSRARRA